MAEEGYDPKLFTAPITEELTCPLCKKVTKEPLECS